MLYILIPIIAFLYASVGFGGATGYLAAMSLFGMPPALMASTALMLNILVASISFSTFYRAGHLRPSLLIPFLLTSIPASFLGGYFKITEHLYAILLYGVLTFVGIRLILFTRKKDEDRPLRPLPYIAALAIGLGVGLLSGMVGIGGAFSFRPSSSWRAGEHPNKLPLSRQPSSYSTPSAAYWDAYSEAHSRSMLSRFCSCL